jgi:glutaredoxin 3
MSTQYIPPSNILVEIYTKDHCPYCVRAIDLIESKNVPFLIVDLEKQPERIAEMLERSNNKRTVPQIFIKNKHIGGCDDLYQMNAQGQLDSLLTTPL